MNVRVWDNEGKKLGRYTVVIDNRVFVMSYNATARCLGFPAKGRNKYIGKLAKYKKEHPHDFGVPVQMKDIPIEVSRAIIHRLIDLVEGLEKRA